MSDVVIVIASRKRVLRAAVDLGLSPVLVRGPGEPDEETTRLCREVMRTDLFDEHGVVDVVEQLHSRHHAVRVISLSEDGLLPAARVSERHGLGGNTLESVQTLKDKSAMRRRLAELGLSPVRTCVISSADDLITFARSIGKQVVVKPLDAGGSAGIHLMRRPDDAARIWADVVAAGRFRMLAEEHLDGPEISVEAFSQEGTHTVVAFTDKILGPRFIEVGHVVPANLNSDVRGEVIAMTVALLDAVGLVEGPSHTEFKLTSDGPRVIESHNRIGGDNIADLVRHVHGVDLERLAVGVPLGLIPWDANPPAARGGAAIRFLTPPPGVVRRIEKPVNSAIAPDTNITLSVAVGDEIPSLTWSMDRVAGHAMATGSSGLEALSRCERSLAQVIIETEPSA